MTISRERAVELLAQLADEAEHLRAGRCLIADDACADCGSEVELTFLGSWCRKCNVVDPARAREAGTWK